MCITYDHGNKVAFIKIKYHKSFEILLKMFLRKALSRK